ncbi:MAG: hypothetical protein JRJ57_00345 [Deltaproteobacteria bacterium]|nr:hypothetical protein [Deltaproteobacteria bacterium]
MVLIKQSFIEGFRSLPKRHIRTVKDRIKNELGWKESQLAFRRIGRTFMKESEAHTLRSIFAEYNIDPFTGEYLS